MNDEIVTIPSVALATMAWHLAGERNPYYNTGFTKLWSPCSRKMVEKSPDCCNPVSAEYYRIIDRIARSEKP